MLLESHKDTAYKLGAVLVAAGAIGSIVTGAVAAKAAQGSRLPSASQAVVSHPLTPIAAIVHGARRTAQREHRLELQRERAARHQPHSKPRATISLYEHTARRSALRAQGCSAARRGVGGIVILDFGQPAYNGHTYGTYLFSGKFVGNKVITRAMFAYAYGYHRCLPRGSQLKITLARGTSNYHPHVPSAYRAGRKWARETMALQHRLRLHGLHGHVLSAAGVDVEPAWDRGFHRTRDFFRGFRDARTGHTIYNYGSLDGGVGSIWNARQVFFVTSGMKYVESIPEIYNHEMARQWAELAHIARHRYHRPLKLAGVMTTHTSANHGMKPRDAHKTLVRALASRVGADAAATVPSTLTNIRAAE